MFGKKISDEKIGKYCTNYKQDISYGQKKALTTLISAFDKMGGIPQMAIDYPTTHCFYPEGNGIKVKITVNPEAICRPLNILLGNGRNYLTNTVKKLWKSNKSNKMKLEYWTRLDRMLWTKLNYGGIPTTDFLKDGYVLDLDGITLDVEAEIDKGLQKKLAKNKVIKVACTDFD